MTYTRVCPRDLFNEGNLLKCIGKIALLIHDRQIPGLIMDDDGCSEGFEIEQDSDDGSIHIANIRFWDGVNNLAIFYTQLNSRDPWPLVMRYKGEEYYPLNSKGEWQLSKELFK